jgi:hypothetical protein
MSLVDNVEAVAFLMGSLDAIGVGGGLGAKTTRVPALASCGKGRKNATDGSAWSAAITAATQEVIRGMFERQSARIRPAYDNLHHFVVEVIPLDVTPVNVSEMSQCVLIRLPDEYLLWVRSAAERALLAIGGHMAARTSFGDTWTVLEADAPYWARLLDMYPVVEPVEETRW